MHEIHNEYPSRYNLIAPKAHNFVQSRTADLLALIFHSEINTAYTAIQKLSNYIQITEYTVCFVRYGSENTRD
jgi:hypothetical protein